MKVSFDGNLHAASNTAGSDAPCPFYPFHCLLRTENWPLSELRLFAYPITKTYQ